MSAESPRHARAVGGGGGGGGAPLLVAPQPPSDRSLMETVSGFISDVALAGGAGSPAADPRDTIQWARFETADVNEPAPESDGESELSPLLLVLGYGSGVQVWLVRAGGEAQEVLSWRQGSVRALRVLPAPSLRAPDAFSTKRPLLALCDSAAPGPLYCSLSFISVRGGDQVKSIKFKNPILDVLANKRSVVVSFCERFAVFDAGSLEDRLAVTTCYPCPCPLGGASPLNPLALGDRWLAYADRRLNVAKRSSGGCEGEGTSSYTASVLHAAKSLGKGLRGLGESVASSLAGARALSQSPSPPGAAAADLPQPGVVTVLDIEGGCEEEGAGAEDGVACEATVAHFAAHSEPIIALRFDASGMLLVTADKRGHDFHVFRLHPHPCGPALASVHHLYVLHRGDTTARVQDIALSADGRWAAVSTLRGTTHVFPVSPYGGACGVRTHTQPRVVNRLSRFHRSAGLPMHPVQQASHSHAHARAGSPVGDGLAQGAWFPNPRLPPYPPPTVVAPLAQLRPSPAPAGIPTHTITRNSSGRQRLSSVSEEGGGGAPLLACARWGAAGPAPPGAPPRAPAAHALYVMAATGHLLHYLIHPRPLAGVAKEKVCEDTPVEVDVELVAQWPLGRPAGAPDLAAPLRADNPLLCRGRHHHKRSCETEAGAGAGESPEERWLAQVEIVTHAGPHRRLWMGPQFVFKTCNTAAALSGSRASLLEAEAVEVELGGGGAGARSPPVNMPGARPMVPVLIDSGSASSLDNSPSDSFRRKSYLLEAGAARERTAAAASAGAMAAAVAAAAGGGDVQLREELAEAMRDTEQGRARRPGGAGGGGGGARRAGVVRAVDPLGTVVAPPAGEREERRAGPGDPEDPDRYTQNNSDEALFRPVVRAAAPLSPHAHLPPAAHLSPHTTIPARRVVPGDEPRARTPPADRPLSTDVVIPAALSAGDHRDHRDDPDTASQPSSSQPQTNVPSPSTDRGQSDQLKDDTAPPDVAECVVEEPRVEEPGETFVQLTAKRLSSAYEQLNKVPDNTEEQMWAMLSEDLGAYPNVDVIHSTVKKMAAEVKPRPRKTRKHKTKCAIEVFSSTQSLHEEINKDELVFNTKPIPIEAYEDMYSCKTAEHSEHLEEIDNLESIGEMINSELAPRENKSEIVLKEFVKAKSSSPVTSCKRHRRDRKLTGREGEAEEPGRATSRSSDLHLDHQQPQSLGNTLGSFDLPVHFDLYFPKNDEIDEGLQINNKETCTDALMHDIFEDSIFSLESSKSKQQSKKNHAKHDDGFSIEPANLTGIANKSEDEQYILFDEKFESKFKSSIPETISVGLEQHEFPTISSSLPYGKRDLTQHLPDPPAETLQSISYSAVASKSRARHDASAEAPEPPRPSLREKLVELCKRRDIAVAECDAPGGEALRPDKPHFLLEEFHPDEMRESLFDSADDCTAAPIRETNIAEVRGGRVRRGEGSAAASDEEGASPVSSQTDSDDRTTEERLRAADARQEVDGRAPGLLSVPAAKPLPAKRKAKKKRK